MGYAKMRRISAALPVLTLFGLMLLAPEGAGAQTRYKLQPIVTQGDTVGDPPIKAGSFLAVGTLNDAGQIVWASAANNRSFDRTMVQYASGKFTLLLVGGGDAPGGKWPPQSLVWEPISMNQAGNIAFAAPVLIGGKASRGTFLWDDQSLRASALVVKGMPAVNDLTFAEGTGDPGGAPVINNRNEIALVAMVGNAVGTVMDAVFLLDPDRKLLPVALPDQELPDGGNLVRAWLPMLNDAGSVAFVARRKGDGADSAYLWEQGVITPLVSVDADVPGAGKIKNVKGVWLNNKNRNVLVSARVEVANNVRLDALYLLIGDKLNPVAVPGQGMPGGGQLKNLQSGSEPGPGFSTGVSFSNDAGQYAILAKLEDGATAAYLIDADGKLSLILKSGTATDLGIMTRVGSTGAKYANGIGLNNKGQIALSVTIGGDQSTIVLLTPTAQ